MANVSVLLVDDDKFMCSFLGNKLKSFGYNVEIANDGDEALEKVQENKPSVILLDLVMPQKDGFMVLEALKKDPDTKDIPVIITSTLNQEEDVAKTTKLGATSHFDKTSGNFDALKEEIIKLTS